MVNYPDDDTTPLNYCEQQFNQLHMANVRKVVDKISLPLDVFP